MKNKKRTGTINQKINQNKNRLTQCRTCKNKISKNAETCPHCGELSPLEAKEYAKKGLTIFIATIVMAFILWIVVGKVMGGIAESVKNTLSHPKEIKTRTTFVK